MGVYVSLKVMPDRIGHNEWHEAYDESVALLMGFPDEIMGLQREKVHSVERSVYSRKIERDTDDPKERHWHVIGDFKSKETGESFICHYDLDQYRDSSSHAKKAKAGDDDILACIVNDRSVYRSFFSDNTQGCPYHIPLLAVAMLFEDRFPKHAHASGDIDIHQARKAQKLVESVLHKKIALPISVDAGRLFQRIQQHSAGKEALDHFQDVYRGKFYDEIEILYSLCDHATFQDWFLDRLRYYKSPGQLGAIDLSMAWLNAAKDLRSLCELACVHGSGPKFDPVQFADALASTWISIEESLRSVLNPFRKPKGEADTVMSQFGSVFFDLGGLRGRKIRHYLPEEKVQEVFVELFPAHSNKMSEKFKKETETIRKNLAEARKGVENLMKMTEEEPESGDDSSFMTLTSAEKLSPWQRDLLECMAFSMAQTRTMVQKERPEFLQGSPKQLLKRIIQVLGHKGPTLTEDAWRWIDNESDLEILRSVLSLAVVDNDEQTFWNARKGLFENRALFKAAFEMSNDKALLASLTSMAEEAMKEEGGKKGRGRR